MSKLDPKTAQQALSDHPYFKYRGCGPDPDDPSLAAGDNRLPVDAWQAPDVDGGEEQEERRARERAAIEVCVDCPVMVPCLAYGSSVTAEGKLAEPFAILGGMTALERHRAFVKTRHEVAVAAPDQHLRTPQKLAVLRALAQYTDPYAVAEAAGMDVRTANWQRSILVTKLNLQREASRRELLAEAARRGLLGGVQVVDDDGLVPAVPPPTRMPAEPSRASVALFASVPQDNTLHPSEPAEPAEPAVGPGVVAAGAFDPAKEGVAVPPVRVPSPRRDRFTAIAGQLSLDSALFTHCVPLEAAA